MSAQAIKAGRAGIEVFLDRSRLERDSKAVITRMRTLGSGLQSVGTQLGGIGLASGTAFGIATRKFASFEQALASVVARIDGAGEADYGALENKALELNKDLPFTAREIAEAMDFLAMAGFDVEQILGSIGGVTKLAIAGQLDLAQASDIASDAMTAFGLGVDEFERVVGVIAIGANSANTNVLKMGETFSYVAPIAKAAGQSIETTAAMIDAMADGGIKASMAGTALREIFSRLADGNVRKQLAELGVNPFDEDGNFRNALRIFEDLAPAMDKLPTGERMALLDSMFGRAKSGAEQLLASVNNLDDRKTLRGFERRLASTSDELDELVAKKLDTTQGDIDRLSSSFEALQISIGKAIGPEVRAGLQDLIAKLNQLTAWVSNNKSDVVGFAKTALDVTKFGVAALVASKAVGYLSNALSVLRSAMLFIGRLTPATALITTVLSIGGVALAEYAGEWDVLGQTLGQVNKELEQSSKAVANTTKALKEPDRLETKGGRLHKGIQSEARIPGDFENDEFKRLDEFGQRLIVPDQRRDFYLSKAEDVEEQARLFRKRAFANVLKGETDRDTAEQKLLDYERLASALRGRAAGQAIETPDESIAEAKKAGAEAAAQLAKGAQQAADRLKARANRQFELGSLQVGSRSLFDYERALRESGSSVDEQQLAVSEDSNEELKSLNTAVNGLARKIELPTNGRVS